MLWNGSNTDKKRRRCWPKRKVHGMFSHVFVPLIIIIIFHRKLKNIHNEELWLIKYWIYNSQKIREEEGAWESNNLSCFWNWKKGTNESWNTQAKDRWSPGPQLPFCFFFTCIYFIIQGFCWVPSLYDARRLKIMCLKLFLEWLKSFLWKYFWK